MAGLGQDIAGMRAFNRFYTRLVGALDAGMLETPFTLSEARFIYEIGTRGTTGAAELARALEVDPGYVSRLTGKLAADGIIAVEASGVDARRNEIALTEAGRAAFLQLDAASDASVAGLIEPLSPARRAAILSMMAEMRLAFGAETEPAAVDLRGLHPGELGWLIHRQALLYNEEYGWNSEFEALIAGLYRDFRMMPDTPPKRLWVAEMHGAIAGSVYIVPADGKPGIAQLRMLYVEPFARGQGIAHRLVAEAVAFSRRSGYREVVLWTQDCLAAARHVYQAAGFRLIEEERHDSFGASLNGQFWALDLVPAPAQ